MSQSNKWKTRRDRITAGRRRPARPRREARRDIENLEERRMLSFTPLPATPLVVNEADPNAIIPFTTVVAKFQDSTANGTYMGTIDWGDGFTDPTAFAFPDLTADPTGHTYDVFSSTGHTYFEENTITPSFSIKAGMTNLSDPTDTGIATNTATVFDAPLSGAAVNVTATEGATPAAPGYRVATFTDPDTGPPGGPNPNPVTDYSATINWGDGSPVQQGTIQSLGGGNYAVYGVHSFAEETAAGHPFNMTVTVVDTDGENPPQGTRATITLNPTATVADAAITLGAPNPPPTTFVEGRTSAGVVGSLTDSNPNPASDDFTKSPGFVSVNWGDGSPTSQGFLQPLGGGKFNIFGVHSYLDEGNYTVTLKAMDEGGATATPVTFNLLVADAPISGSALPISGTEGKIGASGPGGVVATFVDQNPNATAADFSGTINWGDGSGAHPFGSAAFVEVSSTTTSSTWNVVLTGFTYKEEGTFPVTITVNDETGVPPLGATTGAMTTSAVIADAPLSAAATQPTISMTEGQSKTLAVADFVDADPNGGQPSPLGHNDYVASIDWGDGSPTSSGTIVPDGHGGFLVNGTHTYLEEGSHNVLVTVVDTDGQSPPVGVRASVAISNPVTIADAALNGPTGPVTVNATEGIPLSQQVITTFTDTDPNELEPGDNPNAEYSVVINWGDGTALDHTATVKQTGGPGTPYQIIGSNHIFADESGPFLGTITVTDVGGAFVNIPFTTNVVEAPLVPSTPPAPTINIGEGQTFNATTSNPVVRFINSDQYEPLSEQAYTVVSINWGDGSPTSGGTIVADPNIPGAWDVLGSHAYTEEQLDANGNPIPYTVSVTVTESVHSGTPSLYSVVTNQAIVPDSPIKVTAVQIAGVEGLGLTPSPATVATFTDGDLLNTDPTDYTISINWGDGSPTSAGTAVPNGPGNWIVTGVHTYLEEGLYAQNPFTGIGGVTVTVIDTDHGPTTAPGRSSGQAVSTAFISDAPLTPIGQTVTTDSTGATITEGKALAAGAVITVGQFTDANPAIDLGDFSATIAWGDNTTTQGKISVSGGVYSVTGVHTYAEEGSFKAQVFVGDVGGSTTTINSTVVVQDAALSNTPAGTLAGGNPLLGQEGALYSGPIATIKDADPNGGQPSPLGHNDYFVSINWGDGSPTTSGTLVGVGTLSLSGNHVYTEEGTYHITYTVWDTDGGPTTGRVSTTGTADIVVNDAPLVDTTPVQTIAGAQEGSSGTYAVATFKDLDPNGGQPSPLGHNDYFASINWGDGSPTSIGIITGNNLTGFTVTGTHTYAEENAAGFPVTVTIWDTDGGATTGRLSITDKNTKITVADAPLSPGTLTVGTAVEGATTNITASFLDADTLNTNPGDYVVTVSWGDNTSSTVPTASIVGGGGNWSISAGHVYTEEGTYPITVQITDTDGQNPPVGPRASTSVSGSVTVADASLVDQTPVQKLSAVEGNVSGTLQVALFTDNDPNGGQPSPLGHNDYFASINWGDGSPTSVGTVGTTTTPGLFQVTGTHTYAEENAAGFPVTVTIWDTDGGATTGRVHIVDTNTKVAVSDAPVAIISSPFNLTGSQEGSATTGVPLAVFRDSNPGAPVTDFLPVSAGGEGGSVVVNWGDGTALQTLPASSIQSLGGGLFLVRGTHTFAEDGVFAVSVTVNDAGGSNAGPIVDHITVPDAPISDFHNPQVIQTATGTLTNTLLGTVFDQDPGAQAGDYTGTINWGDGTPLDSGVTFQPGLVPGTFNVFGTHQYTTTGTFAVTINVTDTDEHLGTTPPVTRSTTTLTGTIVQVTGLAPMARSSLFGATGIGTTGSSTSASRGAVVDAAISSLAGQGAAAPSGIVGLTVVNDNGSTPFVAKKKTT